MMTLAAAPAARALSQRPSRCASISMTKSSLVVRRPKAAPVVAPPPRKKVDARGKIDARATTPPSSPTTTPAPSAPGPEEDAWQPGDPMTPFISERAEFLERDLPHLFDDVGIDEGAYADRVEFRDPITSYDTLRGYLFNIAALRRVFSPKFVLLGVRQTGKRDLTTRWAMEMEVGGSGGSGGGPLPSALRPRLAFTGTSILTFDGSGKICRHVDTWDSLAEAEQGYFSVPGARNVLGQLLDVRKAPASDTSSPPPSSGSSGALWSPPRQLLRKNAGYEVRRYEDLAVLEAKMTSELSPSSSPSSVTGPGARSAFRALASFIGREKISMTTPVLSDSRSMRFVLAPGGAEEKAKGATADAAPAPSSSPSSPSSAVSVSKVRGGIYAVLAFGGIATDASSAAAARDLRAALEADGVAVAEEDGGDSPSPFLLAQYNGPFTLPPFRLNEVLIRLDEEKFDLWAV